MINQGQAEYQTSLFGLFQDLIDQNLLLENGWLDHRKYKNIITVGLRLKLLTGCGNFYTTTVKACLLISVKTHSPTTLLPIIMKKQYHQALPLLSQVSYTDVYYHLSAKAMMLKIYFEMEEDLAFESLLDTFRIFLNRNRTISAYQRTVHKNLIRFARKAWQLRNESVLWSAELREAAIKKLLTEITSVREVANINWLTGEVSRIGEMD
ncbi:MAG: hypothetical protein R3C61_09440 [Bacteroidia bacterium]